MSAVVGNNGTLRLCVSFLKSLDLVLLHIDCAENKVNERSDFLNICRSVVDDEISHICGHRSIHAPTAANCLFVCLTRRTGTCSNKNDLKPRVIFEQGRKSLSDHTGSSYDTYLVLFHYKFTS